MTAAALPPGPCRIAPQSTAGWLNGADPVAFLHVMKTGGTSFHSFLARSAQTNGRPIPATWADALAEIARPRPEGPLRMISGHFLLGDVLTHFPQARIATILRDPLARLMSLHRYLATMPAYTRDRMPAESAAVAARAAGQEAADWIVENRDRILPQVNNVYAYCLGGTHADLLAQRDIETVFARAQANLEAAAFVGITEEMRDCVLLTALDNGLNRTVTEPVLNVTPGRDRGLPAAAGLDRLVAMDRVLYDRARVLFHDRLSQRIAAALAAAGLDAPPVMTAGTAGDSLAARPLPFGAALLRSLALHDETVAPGSRTAEAWVPLRPRPVARIALTLAPESAALWPQEASLALDGSGFAAAGRSGRHGECLVFAATGADNPPAAAAPHLPRRLRLLAGPAPFPAGIALRGAEFVHG
jgi:hypothetical protein